MGVDEVGLCSPEVKVVGVSFNNPVNREIVGNMTATRMDYGSRGGL